MSRAWVKRLLHWLGSLFALLGLGFVVSQLNVYAPQLAQVDISAQKMSLIVLLVPTYAAAALLLARAWWHLLTVCGAQSSWRWAVKVYGISQLAKYLPGNIFHLAGRQALGMSDGVSASSLAKSSLWELGLIAVVGSLFVFLALPLQLPDVPLAFAVVFFLAAGSVLGCLLRRRCSHFVVAAFFLQMAFLAVTGVLFLVVLLGVQETDVSPSLWVQIGAAYVVAWWLGLLVPGAPAGVGVREAALMWLLSHVAAPVPLLWAVMLSRVMTVLGDALLFLVATALQVQADSPRSS